MSDVTRYMFNSEIRNIKNLLKILETVNKSSKKDIKEEIKALKFFIENHKKEPYFITLKHNTNIIIDLSRTLRVEKKGSVLDPRIYINEIGEELVIFEYTLETLRNEDFQILSKELIKYTKLIHKITPNTDKILAI